MNSVPILETIVGKLGEEQGRVRLAVVKLRQTNDDKVVRQDR